MLEQNYMGYEPVCSTKSQIQNEYLERLVLRDEDNEEIFDEYIQNRREEFYKEWRAYTMDDYE